MEKLNSKNKRIMLILVAGLVLAIIAGIFIYMYLTPKKTAIYVFNDNYSAGETLTSDMLSTITCDASVLVAGKKSDASAVFVTKDDISSVINMNDSLRMDVSSGMPLMTSMLSVSGGSAIEMNMNPSKVAVTVPISDISGVTNDLKEGSLVNIYYTGGSTAGTTLIFQGMKVLSVTRNSSGSIEAATLECTTDESLKLVYAQNYGSLYFGLIDSSGYEYVSGEPSYTPVSGN